MLRGLEHGGDVLRLDRLRSGHPRSQCLVVLHCHVSRLPQHVGSEPFFLLGGVQTVDHRNSLDGILVGVVAGGVEGEVSVLVHTRLFLKKRKRSL